MRIIGPERYRLTFDSASFSSRSQSGARSFSGIATSKKPKLYVVSVDEVPVYVGVTKQSMRNRLRLGWKADGTSGYYGYAWRHHIKQADLDVWCHEDAPMKDAVLAVETIEAEVVFLIRRAGQWPKYQTEIHFHTSTAVHQAIAKSIVRRYKL